MKKIITLLLPMIMVLLLCSCAMDSEKIPTLLDSLADATFSDYLRDDKLQKQIVRATKNEEFDSIVSSYLARCSEADELEKCVNIVTILDYQNYKSDAIRSQFYDCVALERSLLFREKDNRLSDFIKTLEALETVMMNYEAHYYLDIADFLPYEEMKTAITDDADLVICESNGNGYYDTHDAEVEDEAYWWSPLAKERVSSGSVGVQKISKYNLIAGDFDVAMTEKVFYGTSPSDYGNDVYASLYYKGIGLSGSYQQIEDFLSACGNGSVFYWGNDDSSSMDIFFIIDDNEITIYDGADYIMAVRAN